MRIRKKGRGFEDFSLGREREVWRVLLGVGRGLHCFLKVPGQSRSSLSSWARESLRESPDNGKGWGGIFLASPKSIDSLPSLSASLYGQDAKAELWHLLWNLGAHG